MKTAKKPSCGATKSSALQSQASTLLNQKFINKKSLTNVGDFLLLLYGMKSISTKISREVEQLVVQMSYWLKCFLEAHRQWRRNQLSYLNPDGEQRMG